MRRVCEVTGQFSVTLGEFIRYAQTYVPGAPADPLLLEFLLEGMTQI